MIPVVVYPRDVPMPEWTQMEPGWKALSELTQPAPWRQDNPPTDSLKAIADHYKAPPGDIEKEWNHIKPFIVGRLGLKPHLSEMNSQLFRMEVLLPVLDAIDGDSPLKKSLVIGSMTIDNCAEFERDN